MSTVIQLLPNSLMHCVILGWILDKKKKTPIL